MPWLVWTSPPLPLLQAGNGAFACGLQVAASPLPLLQAGNSALVCGLQVAVLPAYASTAGEGAVQTKYWYCQPKQWRWLRDFILYKKAGSTPSCRVALNEPRRRLRACVPPGAVEQLVPPVPTMYPPTASRSRHMPAVSDKC